MSILNVIEARELFENFLLGSLDSTVQQTTLKILEKTILKDRDLRIDLLEQIHTILTSDKGNQKFYPIQDFYKRIEPLLVTFIKDQVNTQSQKESSKLNQVLSALVALFRRCLKHYTEHSDNSLYQFVKWHLDEQHQLSYGAIQLKACQYCPSKKLPEWIKISGGQTQFDTVVKENQFWIGLKRFYMINQLKIDLNSSCENSLDTKIYRSKKLFQSLRQCAIAQDTEIIEYVQSQQAGPSVVLTFQPPFRAESIMICYQFPEQVECLNCIYKNRERELNPDRGRSGPCFKCNPQLLITSVSMKTSSCDFSDLVIKDESQISNLQRIAHDLSRGAQSQLLKLIANKQNLQIFQNKSNEKYNRRTKGQFNQSIIQEISTQYDEYNNYCQGAESLSRKIKSYFQKSTQDQTVLLFSDCVGCSQRYLLSLIGIFQQFHQNSRATSYVMNKLSDLHDLMSQALHAGINSHERHQFEQQLAVQLNSQIVRQKTFEFDFYTQDQSKIFIWALSSYHVIMQQQKAIINDGQGLQNENLIQFKNNFFQYLKNKLHEENSDLCLYLGIVDKILRELIGARLDKRKKNDSSVEKINNMSKEDQDIVKQQMKSQCLPFVENIFKVSPPMDIEFESDTVLSFSINQNILSDALLKVDNNMIMSFMKNIMNIIANQNFQLAASIMMKNLDQIIHTKAFFQYIDIFSSLRSSHGNKFQAISEYFSLAEILLEKCITYIKHEEVLQLFLLMKRLLQELTQHGVNETRQLNLLKLLLKLHKLADQDKCQILEIVRLMPETISLCCPQNSPHIYEILMQDLFTSSNPLDVIRLTDMLHQKIFPVVDFRIYVRVDNLIKEQVGQGQRGLELNLSDLPRNLGGGHTVESLKKRIYEDLKIEQDIDLTILDKLVDDPNRMLEQIYQKFYVPYAKSDPGRETLDMKVTLHIRGYGGHESYPYIPPTNDDEQKKLQDLLMKVFMQRNNQGETQVILFFRMLQNLVAEKRFTFTVRKLIDILKFVSNSKEIMKEVYQCQGLVILFRVFLNDAYAPGDIYGEGLIQMIQEMLQDVQEYEKLKSGRRLSEHLDQRDVAYFEQESQANLLMALESLTRFQNKSHVMSVIYQVTPLIVRDLKEASISLLQHFVSNQQSYNSQLATDFANIIFYLPPNYLFLRNLLIEKEIFQNNLNFIKSVIVGPEQSPNPQTLSILCSALKIVCSVAKGIHSVQKILLKEGIVPWLLKMGSSTDDKLKFCSRVCQDFIDYAKSDQNDVDEDVRNTVKGVFQETQQQKRQLAMQKKAEMMKKFQKTSFQYEEKIQNLNDEKGLFCSTCKEGYTLNPENLLGVYLFTTHNIIYDVCILDGELKETSGVQSVTYFTVIHLQCHRKAVDYTLRAIRRENEELGIRTSSLEVEWDCATKTNVAKCNNFFPLKPHKSSNQFEEGLKVYAAHSAQISKNRSINQYWLILNDLKSLMVKFARQQDLAEESGAGRYEHNIKLIPFQIVTLLTLQAQQMYNDIIKGLSQLQPNDQMPVLELVICSCVVYPNLWKQKKELVVKIIQKLCQQSYEEYSYLLNLAALVELCYQTLQPDQNKNLIAFLTEDNLKTTRLFEEIEKQYSGQVVNCKTLAEYEKYL